MDKLSEIGTNAFFQYDDIDGYRYVVLDFWKTISYRVRICKSPNGCSQNVSPFLFELYLYHIDSSKTQTVFGTVLLDGSTKPTFKTIQPQSVTADIWKSLVKRIERIMSTMVLSVHTLKRQVDELSSKLKRYDAGKIDVTLLLGFEENNVITTIDIISQVCCLQINRLGEEVKNAKAKCADTFPFD